MALMRDAGDVHEERVTAAEEGQARCDACGRQLAPADLVAWDAEGNWPAGVHTPAEDVIHICRYCRDVGGVGRCDSCDRLVPTEDMHRVGPYLICTEC